MCCCTFPDVLVADVPRPERQDARQRGRDSVLAEPRKTEVAAAAPAAAEASGAVAVLVLHDPLHVPRGKRGVLLGAPHVAGTMATHAVSYELDGGGCSPAAPAWRRFLILSSCSSLVVFKVHAGCNCK